eukprot:TRINITY_DN3793_c0_g1_i1.p1 TRINITY_DN3793_c0_g1~~TRINITY_DN3793_c0_g1_i1.p1  ORF type:complete len:1689 (+),score=276.91 TRINITY_DN3793_c0_g1_i1:44-5110(+)
MGAGTSNDGWMTVAESTTFLGEEGVKEVLETWKEILPTDWGTMNRLVFRRRVCEECIKYLPQTLSDGMFNIASDKDGNLTSDALVQLTAVLRSTDSSTTPKFAFKVMEHCLNKSKPGITHRDIATIAASLETAPPDCGATPETIDQMVSEEQFCSWASSKPRSLLISWVPVMKDRLCKKQEPTTGPAPLRIQASPDPKISRSKLTDIFNFERSEADASLTIDDFKEKLLTLVFDSTDEVEIVTCINLFPFLEKPLTAFLLTAQNKYIEEHKPVPDINLPSPNAPNNAEMLTEVEHSYMVTQVTLLHGRHCRLSGSGVISKKYITKLLKDTCSEEKLSDVFDEIDQSNSGTLSLEECLHVASDIDSSLWCKVRDIVVLPEVLLRLHVQPRLRADEVSLILKSEPIYSGGLSRDMGINWYLLPDYWLEKWVPPEGIRQDQLDVPPPVPKIAPTIKFPEDRYQVVNEHSYTALKYWYGGGDALASAKRVVLPNGELEQALAPVHVSFGTSAFSFHRSIMTPVSNIKSHACSFFKLIERACSISCDETKVLKDLTPSNVGTYDFSIRITPWQKPVENSPEGMFFPTDMRCRLHLRIVSHNDGDGDEDSKSQEYQKDVFVQQTISHVIQNDDFLKRQSDEVPLRLQTAICRTTTILDILEGFDEDQSFYGDKNITVTVNSFTVSPPAQDPTPDTQCEIYKPVKSKDAVVEFLIQKATVEGFDSATNLMTVKLVSKTSDDEKRTKIPASWIVPQNRTIFNDGSKKVQNTDDEQEMTEIVQDVEAEQPPTGLTDFIEPYTINPLRVGDVVQCYVPKHGQRSAKVETVTVASIIPNRGLLLTLDLLDPPSNPSSPKQGKKAQVQPTTQLQRTSTLIPIAWVLSRVRPAHSSGLLGLTNLGNTCYLNSGIQCLSHTRLLREYFLKRQYLYDMTSAAAKDPSSLAVSFDNVISDLWLNSRGISSKALRGPVPTKPSVDMAVFHEIFTKKFTAFTAGEQHDAHEALDMMLHALGQELTRPPPTAEQGDQNVDVWKRHIAQNNNATTHLFAGELSSSVTCKKCGPRTDNKSKASAEPFTHLSLSIPYTKHVNYEVLVREVRGQYQRISITLPRNKQLISDIANSVSKMFNDSTVIVAQTKHCVIGRVLFTPGSSPSQSKAPAFNFTATDPSGFEEPVYYVCKPLPNPERIVTLHLSHRFSGEKRLFGKPFITQLSYFTDSQVTLRDLINYVKDEVQVMIPDYPLNSRQAPFFLVDVKGTDPNRCLHCSWLRGCTGCKVVLDYDLPGANRADRHIAIVWDDKVLHKEYRPLWGTDIDNVMPKTVTPPQLEGSTLTECLDKFSTPEDITINCKQCRERDLSSDSPYIEQQVFLTTNEYSILLNTAVPDGTVNGLLNSLCKQRPLKASNLVVADFSFKDSDYVVPTDKMLSDLFYPSVLTSADESEVLLAVKVTDCATAPEHPFVVKVPKRTTPSFIKSEIWRTARRCIHIDGLEAMQVTTELKLYHDDGSLLENIKQITVDERSTYTVTYNGSFQPPKVSDVERDDVALKKLEIQQTPLILIIQLKRFTFNGFTASKLNTHITFPVTGLVIGNHTYSLYAVLNHIGSATAGHYYTQVRLDHSGEWWTFNDTLSHPTIHPTKRESQTIEDAVVTSNAYILFYQREDVTEKHIGDVFPRVSESCQAPPISAIDKPAEKSGCQFM